MNGNHWRKPIARAFGTLCSLVILAGCMGVDAPPKVPATPANLDWRNASPQAGMAPNIYIANSGRNTVTVYDHKNYDLLRTISKGLSRPDAVAFDASGNLYVSNWANRGWISVYSSGALAPSRYVTHGISYPKAIAIDASGKLYVSNLFANTITVYANGSGALLRTISKGISYPYALALDSTGKLYAANIDSNSVTVYRPGAKHPARIITHGINGPSALAFDTSGNLYVANWSARTVTVYAPGSDAPFRTLTGTGDGPSALAFAPSGELYVANCRVLAEIGCFGHRDLDRDSVAVYDSHSATPKLQISDGIDEPDAMVVGVSGKAVIANKVTSSLAVYAAGGSSPLRTITLGVHYPVAAAFGP